MSESGDEEFRSNLHRMWGAVAGGWAAHADEVDALGSRLVGRMLAATAPGPGERVLELACGPGGVGLAAAPAVAPGGVVVLSDVAPEMVAIARERADHAGLSGIETRVLDIEAIAEPDASFDVVVCREGWMFALDPARAAREIGRVLRPGGRAALAVWGPREQNPWLGLLLDAVSDQVGMPVPPPGVPGPFSLSDATLARSLLVDAGFGDVEVTPVETTMASPSFDDWWARTVALAGPVSMMLAGMPAEAADAVRARAREATSRYAGTGGLAIPGLSLLATARRA